MKNTKGMIMVFASTLFLLYLYILLKVILFKYGTVNLTFLWQQLHRTIEYPDYMEYGLQRANFTPFKSIEQNIHRLSDFNDQINLIGNIVIFMPCGIFIRLWSNRTLSSFLVAFVLSFSLSLGLECSQLLFAMGRFDVDDLILNGAGGLLGWGLLVLRKEKGLSQKGTRLLKEQHT
ncbi:VanZ family protein [Paenibacillus sp. YAF4_2]|uniref:VanZ family protein n=1 Tax=Paenibacillus sp. YAF4_2 TaxID=3233085 RepID=UPI003F9A0F4F